MWNSRYWADRFWARRYWTKGIGGIVVILRAKLRDIANYTLPVHPLEAETAAVNEAKSEVGAVCIISTYTESRT